MGSFRTYKNGNKAFYELAVEEFTKKNGIKASQITHKPERKLTADEISTVVAVFNNERSACTVQSCLDNLEAIMNLVVLRGIEPETIYLMANPYCPTLDKCIGYIDPSYKKEVM